MTSKIACECFDIVNLWLPICPQYDKISPSRVYLSVTVRRDGAYRQIFRYLSSFRDYSCTYCYLCDFYDYAKVFMSGAYHLSPLTGLSLRNPHELYLKTVLILHSEQGYRYSFPPSVTGRKLILYRKTVSDVMCHVGIAVARACIRALNGRARLCMPGSSMEDAVRMQPVREGEI